MRCAWFVLFASAILTVAARAEKPVSFRSDIAPILHRRCVTCHNEESAKGGYRLDRFSWLTKAGDSEAPPVIAGNPADSELYRLLIEPDPHDRMPQKADPLPAEEIALVEKWIREGASFDSERPETPIVEFARAVLLHSAPEFYPRATPVTALAFSPDQVHLAASGYYEVTVWNVSDGTLARRVGGLPERITALAWHPRRNVIAVAGGSPARWGTVALIDPQSGFSVRLLCDLPETALSVAFSPDGSRIVAGCGDRTTRIFDSANGNEIRVLRQHADWVQSVAYSSDGKRVVSASRDRTARVFEAETGEVQTSYTGHEMPLLAATFVPGNSNVLSIGRSKSVHVWDAESASRKFEIAGFESEPRQIAVAGNAVITGAADRLVRVHQLSDRRLLFTLFGHREAVQSLAVTAAGEMIATGGLDGEVCVWDLACGTWVRRFIASPIRRVR